MHVHCLTRSHGAIKRLPRRSRCRWFTPSHPAALSGPTRVSDRVQLRRVVAGGAGGPVPLFPNKRAGYKGRRP
jgi:hypothetical protein